VSTTHDFPSGSLGRSDERRLSRRRFARSLIAAPVILVHACRSQGGDDPAVADPDEVQADRGGWPEYDSVTVIDALASPGPFNVPDRIGQPLSDEMVRNAAMSGITAVNVTVSGRGEDPDAAYANTLEHIAYWRREVDAHPDVLTLAATTAEIDAAKASGRLALIPGFQDTFMLGTDLARMDEFRDMGVPIVQLTYNLPNLVGQGCLSPDNGDLTDFGRELVAHMADTGVLVDLSHCGQRTTAEAIELAPGPVSITHSGCSAVYGHPRSKQDAELRAMADKGGVIGIYMMPFLNAEGPATADDFYRHVEYAVNVCGEDHVGIGTDNSITPTVDDEDYRATLQGFADERQRLGIGAPREHELLFVPELNDPMRMRMVAEGLLGRGHGEERVAKILGGNWMRLFREVWG